MQNDTVYIHVCKILSWCDTTRQRSKVAHASVWTQGRCSLALKGTYNIYFMDMTSLLLILNPFWAKCCEVKAEFNMMCVKKCIYTNKSVIFNSLGLALGVCAQRQQRRHKNVLEMSLYDTLRLRVHKQTVAEIIVISNRTETASN